MTTRLPPDRRLRAIAPPRRQRGRLSKDMKLRPCRMRQRAGGRRGVRSGSGPTATASADHRPHRSGWIVPGRAAAREGLQRQRPCQGRAWRALGSAEHLRESVQLLEGDLLEPLSLRDAIERADPDELYHLAGPSFVSASWERPSETFRAITGSAATILELAGERDRELRVFVGVVRVDLRRCGREPQREDTDAARRRRTRSQSSLRTSWSERCAGTRVACELGHPLQPRVRAPARAGSSRAGSRAGRRRSRSGLQQELTLGVARRAARLVIRRGHHARRVADAPARPRRGLRARERRHPHGRRIRGRCVRLRRLDAERYLRVDRGAHPGAREDVSGGGCGEGREQLGWEPTVRFQALIERMVTADLRAMESITGGP